MYYRPGGVLQTRQCTTDQAVYYRPGGVLQTRTETSLWSPSPAPLLRRQTPQWRLGCIKKKKKNCNLNSSATAGQDCIFFRAQLVSYPDTDTFNPGPLWSHDDGMQIRQIQQYTILFFSSPFDSPCKEYFCCCVCVLVSRGCVTFIKRTLHPE